MEARLYDGQLAIEFSKEVPPSFGPQRLRKIPFPANS